MKIYTRIGDGGKTRLIGGQEVDKHAKRVRAYGTVDELNSCLGVCLVSWLTMPDEIKMELQRVQHLLFDCGADVATPNEQVAAKRIKQAHVAWLEEKIDGYTPQLSQLKHFVLPGGGTGAAYLHLARAIARRTEREIRELLEVEELNPAVLPFMNRLSDYLFTLARYANVEEGVEEIKYVGTSHDES